VITRQQLGARLRWIRVALQIRQEDAAAACQKAGPWLSAVEAARTILVVDDLLELLRYYGVAPALLFSEDENGEMDQNALATIVAKAKPWQKEEKGGSERSTRSRKS
jgi:transcriptional regulator with XRE-family HTH domain